MSPPNASRIDRMDDRLLHLESTVALKTDIETLYSKFNVINIKAHEFSKKDLDHVERTVVNLQVSVGKLTWAVSAAGVVITTMFGVIIKILIA